MGNEVLDIQDLAEGAEVQRRMFNRITPPGLSWTQPMFPPVAPFDAQYFDEQFLEGLLGEDKNSVAIYPLSLIQDPQTRETLIYNAEGELIAAIPVDGAVREWPEDADPSRVILQLDLLPAEDVEPYLYTERRIEESLARYNAPRSAKSGGAATRGLEAGEFGICDIQGTTNGTMFITVTNGANVAEVFAYTVWHTSSVVVVTWTNEQSNVVTDTNTVWHQVSPAFNGLESAWECLTTNLVLTNGVGVYENANISSNARIRFYAVANRQDTDGDGLTDGMEVFVHHTNPGNPDTDGDGWSDAEELAAGTNPLDRFSATKLARGVVLNEVLYNATGPDLGYEWIELYCAGRYPVNLEDFVIQVADTAYSNAYVFPSNTWIEPGRFLLLGGSNMTNCDLEVNFRMPNRFTNDPTAAVRLAAETGTNTVVVDCLMYGGSASNFNLHGLDTTGWISSYALSAGAGRSLYRRFNGHDTDQVWDWWYTENPTPNPFADISDSDGDGLTD
ncbi:MAG: lamin tail domain-containing protein, partial [Kiritimatiellia bacterium]